MCLLTYAVNDKNSFKDVSMWCKEFLTYADVKEGSTFPFILVGNKVNSISFIKFTTVVL